MNYTHSTYENPRESADEVLRWNVAHLTRNGINDVHEVVARYNSLVNENKEGREDAITFVECAAATWPIVSDGNQDRAWSVKSQMWLPIASFVKRTRRYKGPSETVPYSTRKLY